jgi:hypothetical protein
MIFDSKTHFLTLLVSVSVWVFIVRAIRRRRTHPFPPGPKGLPFFGNLFQLSLTPWKEFEAWKQKYGKSNRIYFTVRK